MKEGDNNTRFFHRLASFHRRANQINNIEVDGVVYEDEMEVRSQVVHFYQVLYQEIEMRRPSMDGLDFSCIEEDERLSLERVFSKEEVIQVLKEIEGDWFRWFHYGFFSINVGVLWKKMSWLFLNIFIDILCLKGL